MPYFDPETLENLKSIIGPCLGRKELARYFYGNYDHIREREIKLHLIWCKTCRATFSQYLSDLEAKVSECSPDGYYEAVFADKGVNEKIVSIIHTLQCEKCFSRYVEARGDDHYLDRYEERLREYSDPISRLRYLRFQLVKRRRKESSPDDRR